MIKFICGPAINIRNRLPGLDISVPGYSLTKPQGALPAIPVGEIRVGESKRGDIHPSDEAR